MLIDVTGSKVLIVDDTPANIDVLSMMLDMEQFKISAAPNGEVALRIAPKSMPDLILLDVMMPGINGFQVCAELKKNELTRDIPVIFITAKTDAEAIIEAFDVGGADYITKPVRKEEVLARVHHQLALRKMQQEREGLLQNLQQANKKIASDAESKFAFFSCVSHELRTPLGSIIGFSDCILAPSSESEMAQVNTFVVRINKAAKHLLHLVNGILDFSKLEAGKMELFKERFSIFQLLAELGSLLEQQVRNGLNEFSVQNGLVHDWLTGDKIKLFQILINLVGNAAKFTHEGVIRLDVEEVLEGGCPMIAFAVIDTGIGMSVEQMDRIFNPFVQANEGVSNRFGGSGLGLCVSARYAQLMGGCIRVESELDKGSKFTLMIPADWAA